MINTAATQPPVSNKRINASETIPPGGNSKEKPNILSVGESVSDSYIINSALSVQGKQSNVYLAKKWGKSYIVKIYHNGWKPSTQLQTFLSNTQHPNIANIIECGEYHGNYYEIYNYYSEGTLENSEPLSAKQIQSVIIPSINEGLHELHRNSIVHCDIKPSNLFWADNGKRVIIGDCGISEYTNTNGKLIDAVRGTPEYAPRVKALLWSAAMSPAYDYGSFGLVLCKMVLGHSLFEGMSLEEIAKAWERGIELPSQINGRLSVLIKGLINEDEDQRWGYMQVKRWCEGEYMRPSTRSLYTREKKESNIKPLIFGRLDNHIVSVSSLYQLEQAIKSHWSQATNVVKRRELIDFLNQFNKELAETVREFSKGQDADAAVYKLLVAIADDPHVIFYCGKDYPSLSDYIEQLSSGHDEVAKRFLSSGLLIYYLRRNEYEKSKVDELELLIRRNGCDNMAAISTICFAIQGKKTIDILGETVETLDQLIPVLHKCSIKEIDELLKNDKFIAWLNRMGLEKEMRKMKEALL